MIEALESICHLAEIRDATELNQNLEWAVTEGAPAGYVTDPHKLVRDYAMRAIVERYGRANPELVVWLLSQRAVAARDRTNDEVTSTVHAIANLADHEYPTAANKAAISALFKLLDRSGGLGVAEVMAWDHVILNDLHGWLAGGVTGLHNDGTLDVGAKVFDGERREMLRAALAEIAAAAEALGDQHPSIPGLPLIQEWLTKPSAPAPQPAETEPAAPGR